MHNLRKMTDTRKMAEVAHSDYGMRIYFNCGNPGFDGFHRK